MALMVTLAGRVGIEADGVPVDDALGGLGRLALAYLVFERHHPVARDELAEVVWGDALPNSWEQLLRGIVSRLRRCFAAAGLEPGEALTSAFGTYQLHLPAGSAVDVEEAAEALAAAEAALVAGMPADAYRLAERAAAAASRQFLPGANGAWVERRQADLRQLHVRALEARAQAAEAKGDWGDARKAAEEAVGLEPFRESAYLRLMAAHAGAGNRGEALRAYERCRRMLSEELGVDPSPQTEAAYVALLGEEAAPPPAGGSPPVPETLPLPAALVEAWGTFLVGRRGELGLLEAALTRTSVDGRHAVLIGGEPGIGKTALVAQLARAAHARGFRVLYGRSDEDLSVPYQPFAEALAHLVAGCPAAELAAHVADHGGVLARLVPGLVRRLPDVDPPPATDPEADRWLVFGAVAGLLAAAADVAPLLMVLDDLQWAATPTLLLLRHLLRSLGRAPVLLVGTYRDTEVGPSHPLTQTLADLRREAGVERLDLLGLDEGGVGAFVEAAGRVAGDEDRRALARALHAHTAGNPFFVGELLQHLAETGAVYRREGTWSYYADVDGRTVPQGVREVVGRRLLRLSAAANRVLVWAAVSGESFDLDLLERVIDPATAGGVLDAVEDAAASRLVSELAPGRYQFAHALVRDTIYSGLGATRRARSHRDIAEAIEAVASGDGNDLPALAHHFAAAASAGCVDKAVDYAVTAARRALSQAAWEDAVAILQRGLDALAIVEPVDLVRRCDLLLMIAETWTRFWGPARALAAARAAADAARGAGSAERLARAARWYITAVAVVPGGDRDAGVRLAGEALDQLGDTSPALRAIVSARLTQLMAGAGNPSNEGTAAALALARSSGDADALGVALHMRCRALMGAESADDHLAVAEELVSGAPPDGWDGWRSGHELRAVARLVHGDRAGYDADVTAVARLAAHRAFWYYTYLAVAWRGTQALLDGRFDEAERRVADVAAMPGAFADGLAIQMFKLRFDQGRLAEVVPGLAGAVLASPANSALRSMLAFAHAELGDGDEARREFDLLAGEGFGPVPQVLRPVTLAYLAEAAVTLDDRVRAAATYGALRPYAGQVVASGMALHCPGAVDRYLGQLATTLGRFADAGAHFEAALALEARLGAPPLLARTGYWYGRMLADRAAPGDAARGRTVLSDSLGTAEGLGMAALARDARSLLAGAASR